MQPRIGADLHERVQVFLRLMPLRPASIHGAPVSGTTSTSVIFMARLINELPSKVLNRKIVDKKMKASFGFFLSHLLVHHLLVPIGCG